MNEIACQADHANGPGWLHEMEHDPPDEEPRYDDSDLGTIPPDEPGVPKCRLCSRPALQTIGVYAYLCSEHRAERKAELAKKGRPGARKKGPKRAKQPASFPKPGSPSEERPPVIVKPEQRIYLDEPLVKLAERVVVAREIYLEALEALRNELANWPLGDERDG